MTLPALARVAAAPARNWAAPLASTGLRHSGILSSPLPSLSPRHQQQQQQQSQPIRLPQSRHASSDYLVKVRAKERAKAKAAAPKKRKNYRTWDMKDAIQFSLCDAMRYIRAYEVGQPITRMKYEVHVRLRTNRHGSVIRSQTRLPHAVASDNRICVIAPPDSKAARQAALARADVIGEEDVFAQIKQGKLDFDVCVCHTSSLPALQKAQVGRILGPRGLMPNAKMGTVVEDVREAVENLRGGSSYRERAGVVRLAIGQLGFSPVMLKENLTTFIAALKKDIANLSESTPKVMEEVVLSSTHAPGFSLNGEFRSEESPAVEALTGA